MVSGYTQNYKEKNAQQFAGITLQLGRPLHLTK